MKLVDILQSSSLMEIKVEAPPTASPFLKNSTSGEPTKASAVMKPSSTALSGARDEPMLREALQILAILDDMLNSIDIVSLVDEKILEPQYSVQLSGIIDRETISFLKTHLQLENQHAALVAVLQSDDAEKIQQLYADPHFQELEVHLTDSTRTICRLLQDLPALVRRLRNLNIKKSIPTQEFLHSLSQLRLLLHEKLKLCTRKEKSTQQMLQEVTVKEAEEVRIVMELQEQLENESTQHKKEVQSRDRRIQNLETEITDFQGREEEKRQKLLAEIAELNAQMLQDFEANKDEFLRQLESLVQQFEKISADDSTNEKTERQKNIQFDGSVDELMDQYDTTTGELTEILTKLQQQYADESEELERLQKYFDEVDAEAERLRIIEEARLAEEARIAKLRAQQQQAAVMLQSIFRGYRLRTDLKKRGKGKGKKGKK